MINSSWMIRRAILPLGDGQAEAQANRISDKMMRRDSVGILIVFISLLLIQCGRHDDGKQKNSNQGKDGGATDARDGHKMAEWEWRDPLPSGNNLSAVAHGNGTYVVVSDGGNVFVSSDGNSWRRKNLGTYHDFKGVAFAANRFIVVGDSGSLFTSANGETWERRISGASTQLNSVAFGEGKWIAVGESGVMCVSADGISWSAHVEKVRHGFRSVAYGAGRFVLSKSDGIFTSLDGQAWTQVKQIKSLENFNISIAALFFGGGKFLAIGHKFDDSHMEGTVLSSTDGLDWSKSDEGIGAFMLYSAVYVESKFLVFGDMGAHDETMAIFSSRDAAHWTYQKTEIPIPRLTSFVSSGGVLIGVGPRNRIYTSMDAVHWDLKSSANSRLGNSFPRGVAFGGGQFVVGGTQGGIFTSQDAVTWVPQSSGTLEELKDIFWKRGRYVAVGTGSTTLISKDGIHWRPTQSGNGFMPIIHGSGIYAAVGEFGSIFTSSDLVHWNREKSGTTVNLFSMTYGAGQFVAVGEKGTVLASSDGLRWTARNCGTRLDLMSITYAAGRFVALGRDGVILSSGDGVHWTREISGLTAYLSSITYGDAQFVAVGTGGILTSAVGKDQGKTESKGIGDQADSVVGLWRKVNQEGFLLGSLDQEGSISFLEIENPADRDAFSYPELPETVRSIPEFIPPDWGILAQAIGDLNKDNRPDAALVLEYKDTLVTQNEGEMIMKRPRILAILLQDGPNGSYRLAEQSTTFIPSDLIPSRDEPFNEIKINRGVLVAGFNLFMNMGGWSAGNYTYQFQYRNGKFTLIGSTSYEFSRNGTQPTVEMSYNYLTKKKKTSTWPIEGDSKKPDISWSEFEFDDPIGFEDIDYVLGWSIDPDEQ